MAGGYMMVLQRFFVNVFECGSRYISSLRDAMQRGAPSFLAGTWLVPWGQYVCSTGIPMRPPRRGGILAVSVDGTVDTLVNVSDSAGSKLVERNEFGESSSKVEPVNDPVPIGRGFVIIILLETYRSRDAM